MTKNFSKVGKSCRTSFAISDGQLGGTFVTHKNGDYGCSRIQVESKRCGGEVLALDWIMTVSDGSQVSCKEIRKNGGCQLSCILMVKSSFIEPIGKKRRSRVKQFVITVSYDTSVFLEERRLASMDSSMEGRKKI